MGNSRASRPRPARQRTLRAISRTGRCRGALGLLPYGPFASLDAFGAWLCSCAVSADPMFFAIRDRASGVAAGLASYLNIHPLPGSIEIGHVWFAPVLQQTRASTEALYLMMRHAMDDLGNRLLE